MFVQSTLKLVNSLRSVARVRSRTLDVMAAVLSTLKPWLSWLHGPAPIITADLEALACPRTLQHYLAESVRASDALAGVHGTRSACMVRVN